MTPSHYQQDIDQWAADPTSHHCTVNAVAGSGKTTVLRSVARILTGRHAQYLAFNKHIADETNARFLAEGIDVQARTVHSLGMALLRDNMQEHIQVEADKYQKLVRYYIEDHGECLAAFQGSKRTTWAALNDLLDLARLGLNNPKDPAAFKLAADAWGVECPEGFASHTAKILSRGAKEAEGSGRIDFSDMLYLPNRWELRSDDPFDWVLCDEVQDFSAAQLGLILRHVTEDTHGVWVGDPKQSIMLFAGAMPQSYHEVREGLHDCIELPLSICWRCPPNHLELARELVPQIEAAPGRADGILEHLTDAESASQIMAAGDLIICRRNAPLITLASQLIRRGLPARVRGRDFGRSIVNHLRELTGSTNASRATLISQLQRWYNEQLHLLTEREAPAGAFARIEGKYEMALACCEAAPAPGDLQAVSTFAQRLFADDGNGVAPIWLSSIHRAKGLEAHRVFVLEADTLGQGWSRQSEDELEQERNLRYVGLTRAKQAMYLVKGESRCGTER